MKQNKRLNSTRTADINDTAELPHLPMRDGGVKHRSGYRDTSGAQTEAEQLQDEIDTGSR